MTKACRTIGRCSLSQLWSCGFNHLTNLQKKCNLLSSKHWYLSVTEKKDNEEWAEWTLTHYNWIKSNGTKKYKIKKIKEHFCFPFLYPFCMIFALISLYAFLKELVNSHPKGSNQKAISFHLTDNFLLRTRSCMSAHPEWYQMWDPPWISPGPTWRMALMCSVVEKIVLL